MAQENQTNNKAKLIQGEVGPLLVKLTVPMIWGLFALMAFNLVDTIFIGRLGTTYLAAISFTFPVVMVVTNFSIGLGIGVSSVVARAVGEHDHHKIQALSISGLILSLVLVATFVTIGFFTIEPLFKAIGADSDTISLIADYMEVWYAGMIFLVVPMVGNYIIRATGDMLWPAIIMMTSAVINLILDPLLIFGLWGFPRLEMKGAAIATVISWVVAFFASTSILYFREKIICCRLPRFSVITNAWKSILHVSLPATATHMIIPVGVGIVMSMIARFGQEAVAAFGAASRIEMFAFIIFMAISAIIGPFVGQNIGAGRCDRIKEALRLCFKFCLFLGLTEAIILAFFSTPLMQLFDSNPLVIHYGKMYLYMIPVAYAAHGIIYINSGVFNGSGHPIPAAVISICRMFLLYIPLAYFSKSIFGIYGIFGSYTFANLLMGAISVAWAWKFITSKDQQNIPKTT